MIRVERESLSDVDSRASDGAATYSYRPSCAGEHARPREREEKVNAPRGGYRRMLSTTGEKGGDTEERAEDEYALDKPLQRRIDDLGEGAISPSSTVACPAQLLSITSGSVSTKSYR